jgi:isocitrate dehydrogenase (NAD+)
MHTVAVVSGDGIGPEITDAALTVLRATGVELDFVYADAGAAAVDRWGEPLPDQTLEILRDADAILKAPLLAPKGTGRITKHRDGREVVYPSVNNALRRELELFVNVRPVRAFPGVPARAPQIDVVIMREVTEGLYSGIEHTIGDSAAVAVKVVTAAACRRLARYSFAWARAKSRRRVTLGHKANVLNLSDGLMLSTTAAVAQENPDIEFGDMMVDAVGLCLAKSPELLDVIILDNQYGDILSDVCGGLAGGIGLAPGANIGERHAMFEAAHGAAPDIAGTGSANPVALILSAGMLLDHLEETAAAEAVEQAVGDVLAVEDTRTPDLGGSADTASVGKAVAARVAELMGRG